MGDFNRQQIKDAIARNKRLNLEGYQKIQAPPMNDVKQFLINHVFGSIGLSPLEYSHILENQFYASQNFRDRRTRNINFVRGRTDSELVYDSELHRMVTLGTYLRRRGQSNITYNIVSKFARSLTGQFRDSNQGNIVVCDVNDPESNMLASALTTCMNRIKKLNKSEDKDAMNFREMLASGRPVYKVLWGSPKNTTKPDLRFRLVPSDKYIPNSGIVDYEQDNMHTEVEVHDATIDEIIRNFCQNSYERGQAIKQGYYQYQGDKTKYSSYSSQNYDGKDRENLNWRDNTTAMGSYRYYESWESVSAYEASTYDPLEDVYKVHKFEDPEYVRKMVQTENQARKEQMKGEITEGDYLIEFIDPTFATRRFGIFMTPWGELLDIIESPYEDGSSPYVATPPDINGEVWGVIEEIINPQMSMNRSIMQYDALVENAIKGLMMIPDTAVPDKYTPEEFERHCKLANGAIVYKVDEESTVPHKPEQIYSNVQNISGEVRNMITLYSSLVDEASGNYGAAQGKSSSNTASGYALETQNSGLNVKDTIETMLSLCVDRDQKLLERMISSYTAEDYYKITGKEIDPFALKEYNFRMERSRGINSPQHQLAMENELMQFVAQQIIPFEVFAEVSSNPKLKEAKQKMQELQEMQQATMQQQQQLAQQANPNGIQDPNTLQMNQANLANTSPEQQK